MKNIYLLAIFLSINFTSFSQSESGIIGGYTSIEESDGWFVGAFFDVVLSEHLDLYFEVNYLGLDGVSGFQIPVYLKYYPSGKFPFFLQAGAQWDKLTDKDNSSNKVALYSASYGLGVDIGTRWSIQLRGSTLLYSPDDIDKANALQAGLSYRFF